MNFGQSLAEKRDFLSNKENLKLIRNKVNLATLEAAQFGDMDSVMSYLDEISDYIQFFNDVINDYILTYPESSLCPPFGEVSEEDIQVTIKRIVESYIYIFSSFLELGGTMLAKFYVKLMELEETSPLFSSLLFPGLQLFLVKEQLSNKIADIESLLEGTWEASGENVAFVYRTSTLYYSSNKSNLQKRWPELCELIRNSLKRSLTQPGRFTELALCLLGDEEITPDLRISLRSYLLKQKVEESEDLPFAVREFNQCYNKAVKNKEDTTSTTSLISGIYNIKKCLTDSFSFAGLLDREAEEFVFKALGMLKIVDEIFIGKHLEIDEFPASIIRCIALAVQQCLQIHPELVNTHLVYQFIRKVVPFIEKRDCNELHDAFDELFWIFYQSPYLTCYMGSSMTKETLKDIEEYLPEGCSEEVSEQIEKYIRYSEKDKDGRFQDAITSTFIIHPYFLPGGETNIVVDEWMIRCHLLDSPENPFNRESLTISQLEEYNKKKEEELKRYEREMKEFME